MTPPQPRSPLFPYTTLFRSLAPHLRLRRGGRPQRPRRARRRERRRGPRREDRKSTRLNSSHANISYAVFCLKKKKERTRRRSILAPSTMTYTLNRRQGGGVR